MYLTMLKLNKCYVYVSIESLTAFNIKKIVHFVTFYVNTTYYLVIRFVYSFICNFVVKINYNS